MPLPIKIILGLGLGIFAGFFFGEDISWLKVVGDIYILSLQMTVLPYIVVSLISSLGALTYREAGMLFKKCGWILLVLWGLGIIVVLLTTLVYPNWVTASLFSTSMVEEVPSFNYLKFYIPSNIFYDLSNNVVPAVVIFCVVMGIALMGVEKKQPVINAMKILKEAIGKITTKLVTFAPYGVFAIMASYLGTLKFEELEKLQVYLFNYVAFALILGFWLLPGLVAVLTPFKYKEIINPARTALLTAFATGNVFVVLPLLTEASKNLLAKASPRDNAYGPAIDVLIPVSYSFPSVGKILSLSFIPFAGWFSNAPMQVGDFPGFAVTGFFSFFGDTSIAIPNLLNIYQIPADTFRLFLLADNLVGARFGTLVAASFNLVLAILGGASVVGILKVNWKKAIVYVAGAIVTIAIVNFSLLYYYNNISNYKYKEYRTIADLEMTSEFPKSSFKIGKIDTAALKLQVPGLIKGIDIIKERDTLLVGYLADAMPFAYRNTAARLVGFDVEMMYHLAGDLNVKLGFVKIKRDEIVTALNYGIVDLVLYQALTLEKINEMTLSRPYLEQTLAFLVKDYEIDKFKNREVLKQQKGLIIGVINLPYYIKKVQNYLPDAQIKVLNSPAEFFKRENAHLDAFVYSAESASAHSLLHPSYGVAIPKPDVLKVPICFGVRSGNYELKDMLDAWITLKENDRTKDKLYNHWILGKNETVVKPRWSIYRDVLNWVK